MTYDASWDRPHRPGAQPLWQESDCYWFYDAARGVGGFHRIGQQPNRGAGQVTVWAFERGGQQYLHTGEAPIGAADREGAGQRVASSVVEALGDGRLRFGWRQPECEAEFTFGDSFYTPRNWSRSGIGAPVEKEMNADGHLECSGRLRGRLRIGAKTFDVDALAHRDRSWGARDTSIVAQHRMFSGTVGPEFSVAVYWLGFRHGGGHASGFVVRNGVEEDVTRVDLLTMFSNDGLTAVGARALLLLTSGERLVVPCSAIQGFVSSTLGYVTTDTLVTLEMAGRTGFCDLEVTNNPLRGTHRPTPADVDWICATQGLSVCASYEY